MNKCNHGCDHESNNKYLEMQFLNEQLQQVQQRISLIENQIQQLNDVISNLEEFDKSKEDSEMMFSLGPGLYGKGVLKSKEILVNIGANIIVKKDIKETINIIKTQIEELNSALEDSRNLYNMSIAKLQDYQNDISESK